MQSSSLREMSDRLSAPIILASNNQYNRHDVLQFLT
jgi:hypothetical protein